MIGEGGALLKCASVDRELLNGVHPSHSTVMPIASWAHYHPGVLRKYVMIF